MAGAGTPEQPDDRAVTSLRTMRAEPTTVTPIGLLRRSICFIGERCQGAEPTARTGEGRPRRDLRGNRGIDHAATPRRRGSRDGCVEGKQEIETGRRAERQSIVPMGRVARYGIHTDRAGGRIGRRPFAGAAPACLFAKRPSRVWQEAPRWPIPARLVTRCG